MPSSSDYILAKKIFAIKKNYDMVVESDDCCYGPTFIGDCPPNIPGPPGPSGDRYLTSFIKKIHKYVLDTGAIGLQLEPGLAYVHGQSIYCVHDTYTAPFDYFKGSVKTYNPTTGLMHVEHIHSISCDFEYSTERTYKINIDYSIHKDDDAADIAHNNSITLDNTTDDRNYLIFSSETNGPLYPKTSQHLSFSPDSGELYSGYVYEDKQSNATETLSQDDALNFVKKLQPKKFSQHSETHFGFLAEDIELKNMGIAKNNSISYSDFCAPIISVLNHVVDKISQIELRMTQMEQRMNQLADYQKNDHHSHSIISMSGIHRRAFCMDNGKHIPVYRDVKPPTKPVEPECKPPTKPVEPTKPPTKPVEPECKPPTKPVEPTKPPTKPVEPTKPPTKPVEPECKPPTKPVEPECKPPTKPVVPECKPPTKPVVPECKPPTKPVVPECKPPQETCPNPHHYTKEEIRELAKMVDYLVPGDERISHCEVKQVDDIGDVIHLIAEATRKYNSTHPSSQIS